MIFAYKIADVVFNVNAIYKNTHRYMADYLAEKGEIPEFTVSITQEDLAYEKQVSSYDLPDYAYEFTAVYRKLLYVLLEKYDAFFFHCSSIAIENKAVMFTAKSGTGKSTHRNLWLKAFGDKVTVINDDKPIIRKIDGVYYVYGTPWMGKEGMGNNVRVPAAALCFLSRSDENSIGKIDTFSVISKAMNQTIRPDNPKLMSNFLELFDGFLKQVETFDLKVNMKEEAPLVAYNGIFGE